MKINVIIVDDEIPALEELHYLLKQIPQVEIVAECRTGMDAIRFTKQLDPDFVILDIHLPDIKGLDAAQIIQEMDLETRIVFITAYDQYAIQAFRLRAYHYILKPYDLADLQSIFAEYRREKGVLPAAKTAPLKLAIETEKGITYLSPKEIVYVAKEGRGVTVYTESNQYKGNYTLQYLEDKLSSFSFFRTHKGYLVNLEYVKELRSWAQGSYNLYMRDQRNSVVPVSRNYVKELRLILEI